MAATDEVRDGLEGVLAFASEIAEPDRDGRALRYRGIDIEELVGVLPFEGVWGLLVDGRPDRPLAPAGTHPLGYRTSDTRVDVQSAIAELAPEWGFGQLVDVSPEVARDPGRDDRTPDSVRRAATEVFAGILTSLDRGRPSPPPPRRGRPNPPIAPVRSTARGRAPVRSTAADGPRAGIAARLWSALPSDPEAKPRGEQVAALNAALILLADHELAASTFAARVAASAWAGPYRVILAGLGPLGGSLHGGAGLAVEALLDEVAAGADPGTALDALLAAVPSPASATASTGTATHAPIISSPASAPTPIRRRCSRRAEARGLPAPNVDFALAALVKTHRLRPGSAATIFTVARIAGIVAHPLEEYEHRLRFRPRASYAGPLPPAPAD